MTCTDQRQRPGLCWLKSVSLTEAWVVATSTPGLIGVSGEDRLRLLSPDWSHHWVQTNGLAAPRTHLVVFAVSRPVIGQSLDRLASDWMRLTPRPAVAGLRGWVEAVMEAGLGCVGLLTCDVVLCLETVCVTVSSNCDVVSSV